jgi:GNAT superfamily N-acetyltransferase
MGVTIKAAGEGDEATLSALHTLCLPSDEHEDYTQGHWWLALDGDTPIGFAGYKPLPLDKGCIYFSRVGVLPSHRGHRLQVRFMRTIERHARRAGYVGVFSTTYCNPNSANNFIRLGYLMYTPAHPWGAEGTCYWRKSLTP